jgi:hypothetical protein
MKIMGMKNIHITILLVFCCSPNSFGQTAKYVSTTIGTQVWMAENLNADKFRNGDQIPEEKIIMLLMEKNMASSTIGMRSLTPGAWLLKAGMCPPMRSGKRSLVN